MGGKWRPLEERQREARLRAKGKAYIPKRYGAPRRGVDARGRPEPLTAARQAHLDRLHVRARDVRDERVRATATALQEIMEAHSGMASYHTVLRALHSRKDAIPWALTPSGKISGITVDARKQAGITARPGGSRLAYPVLTPEEIAGSSVSIWTTMTYREMNRALRMLREQDGETEAMT